MAVLKAATAFAVLVFGTIGIIYEHELVHIQLCKYFGGNATGIHFSLNRGIYTTCPNGSPEMLGWHAMNEIVGYTFGFMFVLLLFIRFVDAAFACFDF